jgi:uncharacterized protein YkwD
MKNKEKRNRIITATVLAGLLFTGAAVPAHAAQIFTVEIVYVDEPQPVETEGKKPLLLRSERKLVGAGECAKEETGFSYDPESFAAEVLRLTNEARAEAGIPALETDPVLTEMAQARMEETGGKLTHTRPDGSTPDTIFGEYDTGLRCTGEIIMSTSRSPRAVVDGFLGSPAHRENLLNPEHRYVGIGTAWGETPAGPGIAVLELFAK